MITERGGDPSTVNMSARNIVDSYESTQREVHDNWNEETDDEMWHRHYRQAMEPTFAYDRMQAKHTAFTGKTPLRIPPGAVTPKT